MGISGAALATAISAGLNTLILLLSALKKDSIVRAVLQAPQWPNKEFCKEFFQKATPIMLNEGFYAFAMLFINMVLGRQGGSNLSALTVYRTLEGLIMAFYWGLVSAMNVMIGNAVGAGEIETGIRYSRRFPVINFLSGLLLGAVVYLFRFPVVELFHAEAAVTEVAARLMLMLLLFMPLRTTNYLLIGVFRSGGETKVGVYFENLSIWFVSLPMTLLAGFVFHWPFPLVFASSYSEEIVKIGLEIRYLLSNRWLKPVTATGREAFGRYLSENS